MTTLALPERLTYGGVDLASYAVIASNFSGLDELPSLRGSSLPFAGFDGAQFLAKLYDIRRPAIGLMVTPATVAGVFAGTERVVARTNLDALYQVFGKRDALQALTRLMPDATTRSALAEVFSVGQFVDRATGELFALLVTFEMPDPFWYGPAVVDSARSTASSPTNWSMTNPGNVLGRRVTFDLVGPMTSPRITNNTTGEWIEATGVVVASAKHLIIDGYAFTAVNDGVDVSAALTHAGSPVFLRVAPGANSLTYSASSPGGTMTTTILPAYL